MTDEQLASALMSSTDEQLASALDLVVHARGDLLSPDARAFLLENPDLYLAYMRRPA